MIRVISNGHLHAAVGDVGLPEGEFDNPHHWRLGFRPDGRAHVAVEVRTVAGCVEGAVAEGAETTSVCFASRSPSQW